MTPLKIDLVNCGYFGGAVIPELQELRADRIGIHHAFVLPVLCYGYILYFSTAAHEIRTLSAHGSRGGDRVRTGKKFHHRAHGGTQRKHGGHSI